MIIEIDKNSEIIFVAMLISNSNIESHFLFVDKTSKANDRVIIKNIGDFKNSLHYDKGMIELNHNISHNSWRIIKFKLYKN